MNSNHEVPSTTTSDELPSDQEKQIQHEKNLFKAVQKCDYNKLNRELSIESADDNGWTRAFHALACDPTYSTLDWLREQRANLKHKDTMNRNLLHITAYYYDFASDCDIKREIIEYLVREGLDINAVDYNGFTPINIAFNQYYVNRYLVDLFLKQPNIDLAQPDNDGITVLHRAVQVLNFCGIRNLLCRNDVDVNSRDRWGRTPLHFFIHINMICLNNLVTLLEFGADTRDLHSLNKKILENKSFLRLLSQHNLKRSVAGFREDRNIESLLAQNQCVLSIEERDKLTSVYLKEIQQMKKTILCDNMTFYDFLHARRRTCMSVVKNFEIREILIEGKHDFKRYANMLTKNYVYARPLTPTETQAINSAEDNLDVIFDNKLPNLVVYNIKKYLDIEDMVALEEINNDVYANKC